MKCTTTFIAVSVVAAFNAAAAAVTNDISCVGSCAKWSDTLSKCYGTYGVSPLNQGYDHANQFLACLCTGVNSINPEPWGNESMRVAGSVCQSCSTTPNRIKDDLSVSCADSAVSGALTCPKTYLTLCAVQAANGTAANATSFAPLGYSTTGGTSSMTANDNAAATLNTFTPLAVILALVGAVSCAL